MGMHAAYHNKADGTAQWMQRPSMWGSCMAVYQNHEGLTIAQEDTINGVLDCHIYLKTYGDLEKSQRVIKLLIASPFFQNLVNDPKFRVLKTFDKIKGLEWAGEYNKVDHKTLMHIGFNGEAGASGLITGFRFINTVLVYMWSNGVAFRPQDMPDELVPLACFLQVAKYSDNFGSDSSLSMFPATGADFNEYCREKDERHDDVYYDDFTDWLYEHRTHTLTNSQLARVFKRSKEEMLEKQWQTDSLLRQGYMKDEQLPGSKAIPDDDSFNMSISAPLYITYEENDTASGDFSMPRVDEASVRTFMEHFIN